VLPDATDAAPTVLLHGLRPASSKLSLSCTHPHTPDNNNCLTTRLEPGPDLASVYHKFICLQGFCLQCFDAVGWAAGRASGLQKTEWLGAGVVVCLEQGAYCI